MEAVCFCPCPRPGLEGSHSVGSVYSATRGGTVQHYAQNRCLIKMEILHKEDNTCSEKILGVSYMFILWLVYKVMSDTVYCM